MGWRSSPGRDSSGACLCRAASTVRRSVALHEVAPTVIRADVTDVVATAIRRSRDGEVDLSIEQLVRLHHALEDECADFLDATIDYVSATRSHPRPNVGDGDSRRPDPDAVRFSDSFVPYLLVASTVHEYFRRPRAGAVWTEALRSGAATRAAELLGRAVAALAVLSAEAEHRAAVAADELGLDVLTARVRDEG